MDRIESKMALGADCGPTLKLRVTARLQRVQIVGKKMEKVE